MANICFAELSNSLLKLERVTHLEEFSWHSFLLLLLRYLFYYPLFTVLFVSLFIYVARFFTSDADEQGDAPPRFFKFNPNSSHEEDAKPKNQAPKIEVPTTDNFIL